MNHRFGMKAAFAALILCLFIPAPKPGAQTASEILTETGVQGGLVVHLGCGEGQLTLALRQNDGYIVHGLDMDRSNVAAARARVFQAGQYGPVSVDRTTGGRLPYIDNLVNLIVAEDRGIVTQAEMLRVLAPNGVAYVKKGAKWTKTVKQRPKEIGDWTHYLQDASGNAVAQDSRVGPPRRMQWVGSPRWARHHDNMSSISALVSANGRIFYIMDEAPRFSILIPPRWKLIARDAFNGTILWKRSIPEWYDHLHPLKNGPAELPRRLVAQGDRVYVTLGLNAPVTALDAATGKTVRAYEKTESAEELLLADGMLFARLAGTTATTEPAKVEPKSNTGAAKELPALLMAIEAASGKVQWTARHPFVKLALAADGKKIAFVSADRVVCLDPKNGDELWRSEPVSRAKEYLTRSGPTLVLYDDVVLFAGGELAASGNRSWDTGKDDPLTALSAKDGTILWTAPHPLSGYASPEDVFVIDGVVWYGETTSGHSKGQIVGRDVHTGKIVSEFMPDVETYWFHHRCHRGKATVNYLLTSRTGIEYIDVKQKSWDINHWVRGACLYGVMPANGLTYAPQHPCACFPEAKLFGFSALAPAEETTGGSLSPQGPRLEEGMAYGKILADGSPTDADKDWPTYRHDAARSGHGSGWVSPELRIEWKLPIGGKLSSPVAAGGRVFVAAVDTHTVHALNWNSGKRLWSYTVGGRIDSPPTIHQGMVLFGSADGYVYNLRAVDGALVWRFRAAPSDRRLMSFEQLESVWPVHGSVLVQDNVLFCVAGRSAFLDGGMRLYRLEPATGKVLSETVLDDRNSTGTGNLQDFARQHNMPVALPDILSSDGKQVYMRSQPFELDGTRLAFEALPYDGDPQKYSVPPTQNPKYAHLFGSSGFLDDSWWHRTYWIYGSRFTGGWAGYSKAGKVTPAGKILAFDDEHVYGYGRKPEYYRWTTPIEHHLFSAGKSPEYVEPDVEVVVEEYPEPNNEVTTGPVNPGKLPPPKKRTPPKPRAKLVPKTPLRPIPLGKPAAKQNKGKPANSFQVQHNWTRDLPFLARGLVLTNDSIFAAGPADIVDEAAIGKKIDAPGVQKKLLEQEALFAGKKGAVLWSVSPRDGEKQAELKLDSPPVFDGMATANERLYLTTMAGDVLCLGSAN